MFKKVVIQREEWIVDIFGREIPIQGIKAFCQPILLVVLLVSAYNIGHIAQSEILKWTAYFHGICDEYGNCQKCWPIRDSVKNIVVWECENMSNEGLENVSIEQLLH